MCQVVAYRRLKTIENSKTVSWKSGHGRLQEVVVYERFQYKSLTENIFGVLGRWLLMGGGRTWRFDCTLKGTDGFKIFLFLYFPIYFVFILQVWSSCVYRHLHDSSRRLLFDIFRCLSCIFKSRYWLSWQVLTLILEGGGGGRWNPAPVFLICCSISKRFYL